MQAENLSQQPQELHTESIEEVKDSKFLDNSKFVRSLMQHEFEAKRGSVKVVQVDLQPRKRFESRPIGAEPMAIETESDGGDLRLDLARLNSTRPGSNRYSKRQAIEMPEDVSEIMIDERPHKLETSNSNYNITQTSP